MVQTLLLSFAFCLTLSFISAWDFPPNLNNLRRHRRDANINFVQIMNFWREYKDKLVYPDESEEVVLVIGNTGAGKSTLVSALVGRKLEAVILPDQPYLVFVDTEDRVGTSSASKTLIPEAIIDSKRNVTYVDCSGFHDNRNAVYEMSAAYFQNIFMNLVKKIKVVIVVNYDSFKTNGNKNDLDNLFEQASGFVKNITKFHDGIALVVTKVENNYNWFGGATGRPVLLNDNQSVLRGIAKVFSEKREAYSNKTETDEKYKTFVDLIDILMQKDNESYSRIALFRQPNQPGELEALPETKKEINNIADMITTNLDFVEKGVDDIGSPLSASLKITVEQIVDDIFRNALMSRLHKMGNETHTHYLQMEKQHNDIGMIHAQVSRAYEMISQIQNFEKPLELFRMFLDAAKHLNVSVSQSNLNDISDDIRELQFYSTVSNHNRDLHIMFLKNAVQTVIESIENLKNIYDFLNDLQTNLAAYKSQELQNDNRTRIVRLSCADSVPKAGQNITELENIAKEIGIHGVYKKIQTSTFNRFQLRHMVEVFKAFERKPTVSCTSKQFTARGYNVKMSDVINNDCWAQAKIINIFAMNKVFIDSTITKTGEEAQIFILAPVWEVVGKQQILLNGKEAGPQWRSYEEPSGPEGKGADGNQGLPGGPAGHFFGVGRQFINPNNLEIFASGGKGGPGQDGADGLDGIEGVELKPSFFDTPRSPDEVEQYFIDHSFKSYYLNRYSADTVHVLSHGERPRRIPGDGGNGGAGGFGGLPGKIEINGLGRSVNVSIFNNSGPTGPDGRGGQGGAGTYGGFFIHFFVEKTKWYEANDWKYTDIWPRDNPWDPKMKEYLRWDPGNAGENGLSTNNAVRPSQLPLKSPYFAINAFKIYVRENLIQSIRRSELESFMHDLDNTNYIKAEFNVLVFVEEFRGLENQYLKLRDEIDFIPFYDSLLTRIEQFAITEEILENKKVLSFIYTAALTKIFALKKKTRGKTVVNLSRYLDTVKTSINDVHDAVHLQTVQNYRNEYNYTLTKKIQEANHFIKNSIEPAIDELWKQSDDHMKVIIDEIRNNKQSVNNAIAQLEKDKEKVRRMMQLHSILGPLKIAVSCLSFVGIIGSVVNTAVSGVASIAKGMVIGETSDEEKSDETPSVDLSLESISRVTKVIEKKPKQLAIKLDQVVRKLKKFNDQLLITNDTKTRNSQNIENLSVRICKIRSTQPRTIKEAVALQESAEKVKNDLIEFTDMQKGILEQEKQQMNNTETEEAKTNYKSRLSELKKFKDVLKSIQIVFEVKEQLGNDRDQIKKIDGLITQHEHELQDLEEVENQVYETIKPDLLRIEETVNAFRTSVNGSSHAKLDLTKWTVRTTLKDVKLMLQKLTYKMPFDFRSDLERCMEKIDEGISILIDIYDRIDAYSDSVKQAEYIAHIESAKINDIQVTDPELSQAMVDLKLMIHSNILTEKYEIALHAFKQHYFPFAAHVLQKFQLPRNMQLTDTETLRTTIINKIKDMRTHIDESEATIGEYSKYIHSNNVFNNNITGSAPFYVWEYETVKSEIPRLLNGSEIVMKADISKGLFCNSVKYNDIGINFKLKDKSLQHNFTSALNNFKLIMTMIGNNYYRCGEKYYYISFDDDITISYNLIQDETKNWINPNLVYSTIRSSHSFLSPYGMWSIRLEEIGQSVSWDELSMFANETIDLELVGRGHYIEQNPEFNFEVCNEYLDTIYNVDDVVKELE